MQKATISELLDVELDMMIAFNKGLADFFIYSDFYVDRVSSASAEYERQYCFIMRHYFINSIDCGRSTLFYRNSFLGTSDFYKVASAFIKIAISSRKLDHLDLAF